MFSEEKTTVDKSLISLRNKILAISVIDEKLAVPDDLANDIITLWKDEGIQKTFALRDYFLLPDHCDYFMSRKEAIMDENYVPTFEDYLRMRQRTTGVILTKFEVETATGLSFVFEFTDVGGQRSERRKWMTLMKESIDCILFVVAISEYNQITKHYEWMKHLECLTTCQNTHF